MRRSPLLSPSPGRRCPAGADEGQGLGIGLLPENLTHLGPVTLIRLSRPPSPAGRREDNAKRTRHVFRLARDRGPRRLPLRRPRALGEAPGGWSFVEVAGVATDSRDRVFVFNRGEHPVIVFDRDGPVPRLVGRGRFARPHGITIGPDDVGLLHRRPRPHRQEVHARRDAPADARHERLSLRHRRHEHGLPHDPAAPARRSTIPTNLALAPGRLRCTSPTATATPASTSSRPTAACSSPGASRAAGRGSSACRTASPSGPTARSSSPTARTAASSSSAPTASSWRSGPTIARPCQVVVDAGGHRLRRGAGLPRGDVAGHDRAGPDATGGPRERLRPRRPAAGPLGRRVGPLRPGRLLRAHDLCLDSRGDLYVGEVTWSAGGNRGVVPPTATRSRSSPAWQAGRRSRA